MMPRTRLQLIFKFFHTVNVNKLVKREQHGYDDPYGKNQQIINQDNRLLYDTLTQALIVDELLVGRQNRAALIQYIPKEKHHKWGIELWVLLSHFIVIRVLQPIRRRKWYKTVCPAM